MFQVRIHGRGSQGVVSAAGYSPSPVFSKAGTRRHSQLRIGRMGAPVVTFCRFDDKEIRLREPVVAPDALIIGTRRCCTRSKSVRRCLRRRLRADQFDPHPSELGLDDFFASRPGIRVTDCSGITAGTRASAGRCPTPRCSAGSPRSPALSASTRSQPRSQRNSPAGLHPATSRRQSRLRIAVTATREASAAC